MSTPYRQDLEAKRARLRELERELREVDDRIAATSELRADRERLADEAAKIREALGTSPPRSEIVRSPWLWGAVLGALAIGGLVGALLVGGSSAAPKAPIVAARVAVADPAPSPPSPLPPMQAHPGGPPPMVAVADAACARALIDPGTLSDAELTSCARTHRLGQCRLSDASACTTCACDWYVKVDGLCDAGGMCREPFYGTGCSSMGMHGADVAKWHCDGMDPSSCMVRRLAEWGTCAAP